MVTRNPNWSTEILWYETGYTKRKMLSPLKHPTQGKLHCWFCLKLLRIYSPFSLFYSSFRVPDFGVSEQFIWIFPTLKLVNIAQIQKYDTPDSGVNEYFRKKWIWRRNFLCRFFLFILHYYLPFLDGSKKKKKTLHDIFAFNSNSL